MALLRKMGAALAFRTFRSASPTVGGHLKNPSIDDSSDGCDDSQVWLFFGQSVGRHKSLPSAVLRTRSNSSVGLSFMQLMMDMVCAFRARSSSRADDRGSMLEFCLSVDVLCRSICVSLGGC